jgi:hypothetical protein
VVAKLGLAWSLMALCVAIHAVGLGLALRWLSSATLETPSPWPWIRLFVRFAGWIVFLHLIEIMAWGLLYVWGAAMPDVQSAIYFSSVTYTTTGYGDLVLPPEWRLVGAVEALTGILMCGGSTGFFVAILARALATPLVTAAEGPR